jgi:uncharacterized membrane protein
MKPITKGAAVAAVTVGGVVINRVLSARGTGHWPANAAAPKKEPRWRFVTINRPQDEVIGPDGVLPEPLAELADQIDVRVQPAPGDKGTELGARLRRGEPGGFASIAARLTGDDPRQAVRTALRHTKQLLEIGDILRSNENQPTTKPTLTGKPLDVAASRASGEGRP